MFFIVAIAVCSTAAQDVIYFHDGRQMHTKVLKRNAGDVEVQTEGGSISRILINEIKGIQYADGHRITFNVTNYSGTVVSSASASGVSGNTPSMQEQSRISLEGATQSEAALDGSADSGVDYNDYEKATPMEIDSILNDPKRLKRIAKSRNMLEKMAKAGIIMGVLDGIGDPSKLSAQATAAAAMVLLKVTLDAGDKLRACYNYSIGKQDASGYQKTEGCRVKGETNDLAKTVAKQVVLASAVSAGAAVATTQAIRNKDLSAIKYLGLATAATALVIPEAKVQNKVVKWVRHEVRVACNDGQ
jgi:predicted transcriptional regulator